MSKDWRDLPDIEPAKDWKDLPDIKQSGGASGTWSSPGASGSWSEPADWHDLPDLSFTDLAKKRIDERVADLYQAGKTDLQTEETLNTDSLMDSLAKSARNFGDKLAVGKAAVKGLADAVQDKYGHGSSASKGNEVMEVDKKNASIGEDNNIITEEIGRLAGYVSPAAYESITDRKHYSDNEIAVLEKENPALAQEIKSRQRDLVTNTVTGLGNLAVGLVRAPVAGAIGLYGALKEGGLAGGAEAVGRTAADLAAMTGTSLVDTATSPGTKLMNDPVGFLGDAASVVGAGAALKAGAAGAVQAAKAGQKLDALAEVAKAGAVAAGELSPFPIGLLKSTKADVAANAARQPLRATELLDDVALNVLASPKTPAQLKAIGQWLYDSRAGLTADDLRDLKKFEQLSTTKRALITDQIHSALSKVDKDTASELRDILSGERARAVSADWPSKLSNLSAKVESAVHSGKITEEQAKLLMTSDSGADTLDRIVNTNSRSGTFTAAELFKALSQRDIVMTAKVGDKVEDLGSPAYLLFPRAFDTSSIVIKANPLAPEPIRKAVEANITTLESLRNVSTQIGKEATEVKVGPHKKLLPSKVFESRIAFYTPDVYVGSNAGELHKAFKQLADDDAGSFAASKLKNLLKFEQRKAAGATDDLITAYSLASRKAVDDIEKFKLFERLAERSSDVAKPGMVRVPEGNLKGSNIQKFGALSGKYISQNLYDYITMVEHLGIESRALQRAGRKFRAAFGSSKVVLNLVSWYNNSVGNWLHAINHGGVVGSAGYLGYVGREVARGLKLVGDDDWSAVAKRAGIISDDGLMSRAELTKLAEDVKSGGLFDAANRAATKNSSIGHKLEKVADAANAVVGENSFIPGVPLAHRVFSALDNGSRISIFKRELEALANSRGIPLAIAKKDFDLIAEAAGRVDDFHPRYNDVPLLFSEADKYGFLPFARYAWKSIGMLADVPAQNPALTRVATAGDQLVKDELTEHQRDQLAYAPEYMKDRLLPLDDGKVLNIKGMVPYAVPEDLIAAGDRGNAKAQFEPVTKRTQFTPGGYLGDLLFQAYGIDPLSGYEFKADADWFEQGSRSGALADLLLPGSFYHARKVASAVEGEPDRRGRVHELGDAALHALGIKQEPLDVDAQKMRISFGFKKRVQDIENQRLDEMNKINPAWPEEKRKQKQAAIKIKYDDLRREAEYRMDELMRYQSKE